MMADGGTKDSWRISDPSAVHVEPTFKDCKPLSAGEVPGGYLAGSACKVRKIFTDGSEKDRRIVLGRISGLGRFRRCHTSARPCLRHGFAPNTAAGQRFIKL